MKYLLAFFFCFSISQTFSQVFERFPNRPARNITAIDQSNKRNLRDARHFNENIIKKINKTVPGTDYKVDSIYHHVLSNIDSRYFFDYKNGKPSTILIDFLIDGKWNSFDLKQLHYNQKGLVDTMLSKFNISTVSINWVDDMRWSYNYDSNGNNTELIIEFSVGEHWRKVTQDVTTFDNNNRWTSIIIYSILDSGWGVWGKDTMIYNAKGEKESSIYQEYKNGILVNNQQNLFYNDILGRDSAYVCKKWINDEWVNYYSEFYSYDLNGNLVECFAKLWDGLEWKNYYRNSYKFDFDNFYNYGKCEEWKYGIWITGDGYFDVDVTKNYGILADASEQYIYYSGPTAVKDGSNKVGEYKLLQNYPNPFNPITNISYKVKEKGIVSLKVYDILGKEAATLVNETKEAGSYSTSFNGADLPSGIYIYSLKVNNFIQNNKMVLIK